LPEDFDDVHIPENMPEVQIVEPRQSKDYEKEDIVEVKVETRSNIRYKK